VGRRWAGLAAYTAAIYVTLPVGTPLGTALLRWGPGAWLFGRGLVLVVAGASAALLVLLWRRGATARAYVLLALTAAGYGGALWWLDAQHLERVHLPEYGIAAWLAWRAVAPLALAPAGAYGVAAALGTAIGWGDELLQAVIPGRVYDLRDVAANALGVVLALGLLGTLRLSAGCSARE
jgi:hypothetical protein